MAVTAVRGVGGEDGGRVMPRKMLVRHMGIIEETRGERKEKVSKQKKKKNTENCNFEREPPTIFFCEAVL